MITWMRNQCFAVKVGWLTYREAATRPIMTKFNLRLHQAININIDLDD